MEEKPLFTEERQRAIVAFLRSKKQIFVDDLCKMYGVSSVTIRSDLSALEKKGYLTRTHGGAILNRGASYEMTTNEKRNLHIEEKNRIGEYAASLIQDGDSIVLDCGTTSMCLAEYLGDKKDLTVVTNDLKIAAFLEDFANTTTIIIGGKTRKGHYCSIGSIANQTINSLRVDKSFIVTNAVDDRFNLSTPDTEQSAIKRSMLNIGKEKILLCDSSKFNSFSLSNFATLKEFDIVVTDKNLNPDTLNEIKNLNIRIELV